MKERRIMIALAAFAVLATSCVDEIDNNKKNKNSKEIALSVSTDKVAAVKSGTESWAIADDSDLMAGEMKLTLSASASVNAVDPFSTVATKGTIIDDGNLSTIGTFDLYIPEADKVKSVKVSADGDGWAIQPAANGDKAEWPAAKPGLDIDFYAYTGGELQSDPLQFEYTVNSTTASSQKDLLYTHVRAKENDVEIKFYHALSAVRFIVGDLKSDVTVKSISIKNVAGSGKAAFSEGGEFSWSLGQERSTFSQSFEGGFEELSANVTYFDNAASSTFFVIPQSVEGVKFEIVIVDGIGNEYPVEAAVPALADGWKAGYFYTYSISGGEGTVSIDIDETFTGSSKSAVKGHNDGKLKSYVRAAVVGNWCNSANKVAYPWDGTISVGSNWVKIGDFYYYKNPVAKDAVTDQLFTNTVTATGAPAGTHLELHIAMQAVEYDSANAKVQEAWPEAASLYASPSTTE